MAGDFERTESLPGIDPGTGAYRKKPAQTPPVLVS
jgi:hypothetical protein